MQSRKSDETAFDARFAAFFKGLKTMCDKHLAENYPSIPFKMTGYAPGRRYIKVVRGSSVHCFVDTTNGDVLKAASWKAPAKHARGNIWNDDNGLGAVGVYGAHYL